MRNTGLAIAGVFAIPCLALGLAAYLGSSTALVFHAMSRRIFLGVFGIFAIWMMAGLFFYPHAPIVMRDGEFQDKQGRKYSVIQYERFVRWESSFLLLGLSTGIGVLASLPGGGPSARKEQADKEARPLDE